MTSLDRQFSLLRHKIQWQQEKKRQYRSEGNMTIMA